MTDFKIIDPAIKQEIATVQKDITWPAYMGILRQQDDTLLTRGGARSYLIYDDIERDCHAYGVLQKRKLAVIARPWQVDPASQDSLDIKAADMVRQQLMNMGAPTTDLADDQVEIMSNFDLVCYNLLDAILKGFGVGEAMYSTSGNEVVIHEIRPREQRRFGFDSDYKLRLKTFSNLIPGEPVPPRKFIVHSFGAKNGNPFGLGLGSKLFWPAFFKRQGITFWLAFLDKFGSPTSIGKYPSGAGETEQQKLLDALAAIAQDTGVIIPEGMAIEFLEASRSGSVSYEAMCRYMDEQMSFAVLGDSPSTKGSGGQLASAANIREEVRLELVQADADLLSATLNSTISAWLTFYNCPGARPPKIWRQVKAAEDLKARSERDKNIFALGYRPTLAQITEAYGGEWEPVPVAAVAPAATSVPKPADFAEADSIPADIASLVVAGDKMQQDIKQAATSFADGYRAVLGGRVDDLLAMLEESGDLATFAERLSGLLKAPPPQALVDSLQTARLNARLAGLTGKP